jgi:hypothetical protein
LLLFLVDTQRRLPISCCQKSEFLFRDRSSTLNPFGTSFVRLLTENA